MDELIRYLGIDTRAELLAERLWNLLQDSVEEIIAGFYNNTRHSSAGLMLDEATIERLKLRQKQHWQSLFSSAFDERYVRSVSMIGIKHHEIGLDSKWYIAGYAMIKAAFAEKILEAPLPLKAKSALIVTLEKYVAIDMALALSAYSSWLVD
jgi:Protoglobin